MAKVINGTGRRERGVETRDRPTSKARRSGSPQPCGCHGKGPSIYDVHTEGRGGQAQVDGGRGPAPCGRPHRKLKLEPNDVTLSSSHAKKLASFLPEFRLWTEKKWKFSAIEISYINY